MPPKPVLSPREAYILDVAPTLLAAIIMRRRANNANADHLQVSRPRKPQGNRQRTPLQHVVF